MIYCTNAITQWLAVDTYHFTHNISPLRCFACLIHYEISCPGCFTLVIIKMSLTKKNYEILRGNCHFLWFPPHLVIIDYCIWVIIAFRKGSLNNVTKNFNNKTHCLKVRLRIIKIFIFFWINYILSRRLKILGQAK